MPPKIAVCLWFDDQAEEAAKFYTSLIPNSEITGILRPDASRPAVMVNFTLGGAAFQGLNGGPHVKHNEAASISVSTKDQAETDRLWDALLANGGSELQCAWLKDRFGVHWQIVPEALPKYLGASDTEAAGRAMQAMLGMKKIVVSELEAAFRGA
ncbi:MAG: VOC family protein [bacterium]